MAYFINGKETPLERSSLNPKIRRGRRTIDFTNNSFRDSHNGSSLNMESFQDECKLSLSNVFEVDALESVGVPKMKNVLLTCFGGTIGHVNDSDICDENFRISVDVKKNDKQISDDMFEVSVVATLEDDASGTFIVADQIRANLSYDQDRNVYTSISKTEDGRHIGRIPLEFEIGDIFLLVSVEVLWSGETNEFSVVVIDQAIDGSRSMVKTSDATNITTNTNKQQGLRTGILYTVTTNRVAFFLHDVWINQEVVLKKYKLGQHVEDVVFTEDNAFTEHDMEGFDEFSIESSLLDFQYDVEFLNEDGSQRIIIDVDFMNVMKHKTYHNLCFLKPTGNDVTIKNITKKKIVVQSLSYE